MPKDVEPTRPVEKSQLVVRHVVPTQEWISHWRSPEEVNKVPIIEVDGDPALPVDSLVPQEVTIKSTNGHLDHYDCRAPTAIELRYGQEKPGSSVVYMGAPLPKQFQEEFEQGPATGALVQIADLPKGCHILIDGDNSRLDKVQLADNVQLIVTDKDGDHWQWQAGEPGQWVRENVQPTDKKPASCTNKDFYMTSGDQYQFTIHPDDGPEQRIVLDVQQWRLPGKANRQVGTVKFAVRRELPSPNNNEDEVLDPLTEVELDELLATVKQIASGPLQKLTNAAFQGGVNVTRVHTLLANAVTTNPNEDALEQSKTYKRFHASHIEPLRAVIDNAGQQFPSEKKRQLYRQTIYDVLLKLIEEQWQQMINEKADQVIKIVLEIINPKRLVSPESLESNLLAEWQKQLNLLNRSDLREIFLVVENRITNLLAAQSRNRIDSYIDPAKQSGNSSLPPDILQLVAALEADLFAKLPGTTKKTNTTES